MRLETLMNGNVKREMGVLSHLHLNVMYIAEADANERLIETSTENQAVKWWPFQATLNISEESEMVEQINKKLRKKCRQNQVIDS